MMKGLSLGRDATLSGGCGATEDRRNDDGYISTSFARFFRGAAVAVAAAWSSSSPSI